MSYYDEGYYREPTEFEEMLDSFKESLASSIKEETQKEMTRLRKEVAELKAQTTNLRKLEKAAEYAQQQAETKARLAEHEAKTEYNKKKFGELIKQLTDPKYVVYCNYVTGEKCAECDERRYITFTSPQGREEKSQCQCADRSRVYEVREECVVEVQKSRQYGQPEYNLWYEARPSGSYGDDDYVRSRWVLKPEDLTQDELLKKYSEVGFDSKEEAQKLAEALNDKEKS